MTDTEVSNLTPVQREMDIILEIDDLWTSAYQYRNPAELESILAPDWMGFSPVGYVLSRQEFIDGMSDIPRAEYAVKLEAWSLLGSTGMTRGTMFADGHRVQSFMRVYSKRNGQWKAVSLQVLL